MRVRATGDFETIPVGLGTSFSLVPNRPGPPEQASAHSDMAMDLPAIDWHPGLRQRELPGEDVGTDRVDELRGIAEPQHPSHRQGLALAAADTAHDNAGANSHRGAADPGGDRNRRRRLNVHSLPKTPKGDPFDCYWRRDARSSPDRLRRRPRYDGRRDPPQQRAWSDDRGIAAQLDTLHVRFKRRVRLEHVGKADCDLVSRNRDADHLCRFS